VTVNGGCFHYDQKSVCPGGETCSPVDDLPQCSSTPSERECDEYILPGTSEDHTGKRFLLLRILYSYEWSCALANPLIVQAAVGIVLPKVNAIFTTKEYYNGTQIRRLFRGSLGVDFAVQGKRDLTEEQKADIAATVKIAATSGALNFAIDSLGISANVEGLPMVAVGDSTFVNIENQCTYFTQQGVCENDGVCNVGATGPECLCEDGFSKPYCSNQNKKVLITVLIVLCVFAGVLLVLLVVLCCRRMRKRAMEKESYYHTPSEVKQPPKPNTDPYSQQVGQPVSVPPKQMTETLDTKPTATLESTKSVKVFQPLVLHYNPGYDSHISNSAPQFGSNPVYSNNINPQMAPPSPNLEQGNPRYKVTKMTPAGNYAWVKM
jgi:hypothetical protein